MDNAWLRFLVAVLATWRVTHLLAREDGPAGLVVRLRARLGDGLLGELIDCFYCLSLWVAAPAAVLVFETLTSRLLGWLALSGAACLLERLGEPPIPTKGDSDHAMLRPEASGHPEPDFAQTGNGSRRTPL